MSARVAQEVRICFACERTSRQADRETERETNGRTVNPASAPHKCPERKWSALALSLWFIYFCICSSWKSETNVILSCRNSKENCDRTLSVSVSLEDTRTLVSSILVVSPLVSYVTLWRRRGASLDKIYGACVKIRERLLRCASSRSVE